MTEFPSKLIENAVREISKLPGIGKKTAIRLVLYLLKEDKEETAALAESLVNLRSRIQYCKKCHNVSDEPLCGICGNPRRDQSVICIVEDIPDVMAIENTARYNGLYHVLGGLISPMEGVGPGELNIQSLIDRVSNSEETVREVIFALSPTMEGDTTAFYISKKLKDLPLKISAIARGIPIGGNLEYADEITLGRSIQSRTAYEVKE